MSNCWYRWTKKYCTHFVHSKIGNCRGTLWSNLITGRIIHHGKKAAKDVLQRFVCLMLSTFPFCTTTEMSSSSWKVIQKDAFLPSFFRSLSAIRRIVSFLLERRTKKVFHWCKINLIKGIHSVWKSFGKMSHFFNENLLVCNVVKWDFFEGLSNVVEMSQK